MTDKTQPEALRLAEQYDYGDPVAHSNMWKAAVCNALRRQHARIAELEAELEAVGAGGVQTLSAAPVGWKLVPVEPTNDMQKAADEWAAKGFDWPKAVYRAMLAASPTPPAEQTVDPDGEAFRTAARLGLTLRFYGSCAQSSIPGTPSAYVVTHGSDRAEAMREAVEQAAAIIASGGEAPIAPLAPPAEQQAAPKAAPGKQFDAEGFRAWVRKNLPDDTIIGSSAWWADHLTTWAQRFVKAAPQQEAQEPVWDGKLSDAMQNALDALYLECGPGITRDITHQVQKECEAIYTSYTTTKRMYQAARDRLELLEAAQPQPDPFAAPQPAPAPLSDDAKDAARWRWLSEHIGAAWNEGKFTSLVRIVSDKNRAALNASIDRMMTGDWSDAALAAQRGKQ